MVNVRWLRRLDGVLAATRWGLLALVLVMGARIALSPPGGQREVRVAREPDAEPGLASPPPAGGLRPLAEYAPIWQRDLRQSPVPPTPAAEVPVPAAAPPEQPLPRLLGTFVEGSRGWALLASGDKAERLAALDEQVDGYTVALIEPGRAQLRRGSAAYWIEVPRPPPTIGETP